MNQTNTVSNPIISLIIDAIGSLDPASDHFDVNKAHISRSIKELSSGEVQAVLSASFEEKLRELGVHPI